MSNVPEPVTNPPQSPKGGNGKKILLIVLLFIVALIVLVFALPCCISGVIFKNKLFGFTQESTTELEQSRT